MRVRTPTVLQMEAVECGAASLAIVLAHFGKWVPLEEVRAACNVSRDGSNARDIVMAARTYGLDAKGYRYNPDTLATKPAPFIAHWQFRHFLVVDDVGRRRVRLNDPAVGPRTVSREEFDRNFTGLVLMMTPGDTFVPSGRPPGIWRRAIPRLRPATGGVALLALLALLVIIPGLVVPTLSRLFVDEMLVKDAEAIVRPIAIALALAVVAQAAMTWLQEWTLLRIENKLSLTGPARFLTHLFRLPMVFFTQRNAGDIIARLQANDTVARVLGSYAGRNVANLLGVGFFGAVMMMYDPVLAGAAIVLVAASAIGTVLAQRAMRDASMKMEMETGMLYGTTAAGLAAIETVKASGGESDAFGRWAGYHGRSVNTEQHLGRIGNAIAILPAMSAGLATALVLGLGSLRVTEGVLTIGGLVAFHALMGSFTRPFQGLVGFLAQVQTAGAALTRVEDVLNHPVDPVFARPAPPAARDRVRLSGRIELRGVTFGYAPNRPPLVKDLDLVIEAGSRVAIVGATGSGKSTVAKLIAGLMRPWEGEILFDGVPADALPEPLRRSSIGWVSQDIVLFAGTVYDNLTLWDTTIPLEVVTRAARDAEIHDAIAARSGGYNALVEEGGANLSGGQAQRLEIARTLALDPTILVLDEATSALDPIVEHRIDRNIRRRGISCVMVAHRLSTIRDAEEIVVLDGGVVVERGTHESLIATGGRYRALVDH